MVFAYGGLWLWQLSFSFQLILSLFACSTPCWRVNSLICCVFPHVHFLVVRMYVEVAIDGGGGSEHTGEHDGNRSFVVALFDLVASFGERWWCRCGVL